MATKLGVLNAALTELGQRVLTDTGEAVEAGRVLSSVYDNVVQQCLTSGSWNFAMETVKLTYDTGDVPNFGYAKVFSKPTDWLRTSAVSEDEFFYAPLTRYYDDSTYLSAENSPIYLRYVSNDTGLGLNLTRWPQHFTRYVELELAERVCLRLTQSSSKKDDIEKDKVRVRREALAIDAMNEAQPKFTPPGSWSLARGGRSSRRDRGSRSTLIG